MIHLLQVIGAWGIILATPISIALFCSINTPLDSGTR